MSRHVSRAAESVIGKDEMLPDPIRKIIVRIVAAMMPYEELASGIAWDDLEEQRTLQLLLATDGVYSSQLFTDIDRLSKHIPAHLDRLVAERGLMGQAVARLNNRMGEVMTRCVHQPLYQKKCYLGLLLINEANVASHQYIVGRWVRDHGLEFTGQLIECEPTFTPAVRHIMRDVWSWYMYANDVSLRVSRAWPGFVSGLSREEMLSLLNDVDLEPTGTRAGVPFCLPQHLRHDRWIQGKICVTDKLDPRLLAVIILQDSLARELTCAISRVTGDLVTSQLRFTPLRPAFARLESEGHYEYLREHCLAAVFEAVQRGDLKENPFATGDALDRLKEAATPVPGRDQDESVELATDGKPFFTKTGQVLHLPGSMRLEKTPRRLVVREGRLSWRRIMSALRRCGVTVDLSRAHPKLHREGRTASLFNAHNGDANFNRRILEEALTTLGISRADFFREL